MIVNLTLLFWYDAESYNEIIYNFKLIVLLVYIIEIFKFILQMNWRKSDVKLRINVEDRKKELGQIRMKEKKW